MTDRNIPRAFWRRGTVALLWATVAASGHAGTASAPFTVNIVLNGGGAGDPVGPEDPGTLVPTVPPPSPPPSQGQPPAPSPAPGPGESAAPSPAPAPGNGETPPAVVPPTQRRQGLAAAFCISGSQLEASDAQVRVVCNTAHFVRIDPSASAKVDLMPLRSSFGMRTFRGLGMGSSEQLHAGTVTSLRVFNVLDARATLEMLISF